MSKRGLGRGLGALITERETDSGLIKEIMLENIFPNPDQPRRNFDQEKLQELADSIREHGLLQPILVKPDGNRYHIIAGERRYQAAKLAGLDRIECLVKECTPLEMTEKALVENIQRTDLSPVEEGLAYAHLIEEYGLTQDQVAKRVGKGRATVANLLRIIQLPAPVIELLDKGSISLGHAKVLLSLKDPEDQVLLANRVVKDSLSVRELEEVIKSQSAQKPSKTSKKNEYNIFTDLEEKLRTLLQTKVVIKGQEEKGKFEISYYSKEEFNRLLEMFNIKS
ncbi:MAG: ParB/RepB/Spo0J family partition protein [Desulfitobacteriia bacterium]